ncbi:MULTISPECIES: aminotransferase class I/II-fold pyridoxal phosphate-dependent enzyme [Psychrilyobacter]|nr:MULTISPECIES: pyridoxal phosphate-dependent aminotransferase family protein [Psychrilyobacter]MCS5421810.1 pyridoxal phosphate-dependent aminotransferase family protein [Psychrilyobacter sp. S5]NDI77042.1 pyridoxal phosphate-dependent aminotransferase family protein [Psychrilyobacter piezotolerans]
MFYRELLEELEDLKRQSNYRELKVVEDSYILDFSSNDYLDLNSDKNFKKKFIDNLDFNKMPFGSCGSRLLGGNHREIRCFEDEIDEVFKKKSLVFGSGYDANATVIETFYSKGDIIFTDRYNHASIYDGLINSGVKIVRYKHLDYLDLEKKLKKYRNTWKRSLIITESIYSMDGDIVDLDRMVSLKNKYDSQLYLDEAHSYGVLGYGLAHTKSLTEEVDFIMLGLGKGGSSNGGILILDNIARSYIINRGRKFIYTTAPSPIQTSWNRYVFKNMPSLDHKRKKLNLLKKLCYKKLKEKNIETVSTEQIISIIIGDNKRCIELSEILRKKGYLVYPIKEPTVPKGTARIRLTLTADMDMEKLMMFIERLEKILIRITQVNTNKVNLELCEK